MKRQIHAVRGHEVVTVPGHDVKLGRGGIREIEFFVQTQQLIFGGRRPRLRGARTLDMLSELRAESWVTREAEDELAEAYLFLRRVEHRLQMVCRRADPTPAHRARGAGAICALFRLCDAGRLRRGADAAPEDASKNIMRDCSRRRRRSTTLAAASSSPASSTIPTRCRHSPSSASSARKRRPRPSVAGISAAARLCKARARAKC